MAFAAKPPAQSRFRVEGSELRELRLPGPISLTESSDAELEVFLLFQLEELRIEIRSSTPMLWKWREH